MRVKTTLDLPDTLAREVKSFAASRGVSMRLFVTQALADKLEAETQHASIKPWVGVFDGLAGGKPLQDDLRRLERVVEETFEQVDQADWR
jgi:hypothetical protein